MSRASIAPSESRRTMNGSAVVAIGVDRHGVGRDNGACCPLPFSRRRVRELRLNRVLGSSSRRIHREFICVRYGIGGVGLLPSEQLLLPSRVARFPPWPTLCSHLYSPECLETRFCELRHNGVLRSSDSGLAHELRQA